MRRYFIRSVIFTYLLFVIEVYVLIYLTYLLASPLLKGGVGGGG